MSSTNILLLRQRGFLSLQSIFFNTSTKTCLVRWAKLVDAILLSVSAFLFSLLDTFLMENFLKLLISVLAFSSPATRASYSASLLDVSNSNLKAYVNFIPFGFVRMILAPGPSKHEDPSVKRVYGSGISSSTVDINRSKLKGPLRHSSGDLRSTSLCARLTKYIGTCCESLSVNKTALIASLAAHKYMIISSFGLGAVSIRILKKGSEFSTDLDRNQFRLASFPARFDSLHVDNLETSFFLLQRILVPYGSLSPSHRHKLSNFCQFASRKLCLQVVGV
ncbi:hypothetical protein Tco_1149000 [Tanacetum coccineum]